MLPKSYCFIDVETSGLSATYNRIIEIGIVKVENDKVVKKYKTLLNPQTGIDPFIEQMTGISYQQLENAPTFYDIKDELLEILKDSIFIAHNVRFDYGFIRNEFKRVGISFTSKHFCTVKLARLLYPNQRRYNLDSIIENFNIKCKNRHRAYDDANVLWEFYKKSKKTIKKELFKQAIDMVLNRTTLPSYVPLDIFENLPESPGVYIFYGEEGAPLYIGKSVNIKDRVLSHFSNDHLSSQDMKISQQVRSVEALETAGELGALLLESTLIKKHQPLLNRMLRERKKLHILLKHIDDNGYNTVRIQELESIDSSEITNILGVFKNAKQTKQYLYQLAKDYKLCPKILGLTTAKSYCFYYHLKQCLGACNNEELNLKYNLRFDEGFYKKKVKPWNFDKPIVIKESAEKEEAHIIDKWCYLGSVKDESETITESIKEYKFDYDTYKILHKYLSNPKNLKNISYLNN